jgi:hypothetical protein
MSGVEFEGESQNNGASYNKWQGSTNDQPTMVRWLMARGIAKTVAGANQILIGIAVVAFCLSMYFFFFSGPGSSKINPGAIPPGAGIPGATVPLQP